MTVIGRIPGKFRFVILRDEWNIFVFPYILPLSIVDVQHSNVRFLGSLVLNLWDCGGQDAFYESYFESRREDIFSNVAILIYVFDALSGINLSLLKQTINNASNVIDNTNTGSIPVPSSSSSNSTVSKVSSMEGIGTTSSSSLSLSTTVPGSGSINSSNTILSTLQSITEKDLVLFDNTITALAEYSPGAPVVCLVHKMDLIPENIRTAVFTARADILRNRAINLRLPVSVFATSIWDETLYQAWSTVMHTLVPNVGILEDALTHFAKDTCADEIVLFERASFLVIASSSMIRFADPHRFEKISNIVKQFKLTCSKGRGQFVGLLTKSSGGTVIIDSFTTNTYILITSGSGYAGQFKGMVNTNEAQTKPYTELTELVEDKTSIPTEEAILLNIALAKPKFESLISEFT